MDRRVWQATCAVFLVALMATTLPAGAAPAVGSTLRIGIDVDAGTLDPRLANDTTARRVIEQVYDGLVELDPQVRPVPALAESWTQVSPTVWVFKLRKNVRFHDGTPLSADDVVFTYQTVLDPAFRAPLRGLFTPISKIEAVDPETVRVTLSAPYAPLFKYLDLGIVSKKAVERLGVDYASQPVGTGPYKFVAWQRNSRITLEANPGYWKGAPKLGQVIFNIIPDNTTRAAALESGDVDLIHSPLSPQDVRRLKSQGRVQVHELTGLGLTYLNFNVTDPILSDVRVRQAIAHLIPQQTIVKQIYQDMDRPATSMLLPAWTEVYSSEIAQPGTDLARAKVLLAEAGWTRKGDVLERDGRRLTLVVRTHSEDPNRVQVAELLVSILRSYGVDARTEITEFPALLQALIGGTYQLALVGWLGLVDPDRGMYNQFHSQGSSNWEKYRNPRVDALLDEGRQKSDPAERARIYREVARIVAADLPYYVLTYQGYIVAINKRVQGFTPNPSGSFRALWATSL